LAQSCGPAHRMALVAAEIVHDDNVAGLERRHEELLDIGFEAFSVDRSIKDAKRVDPVVPQGRKECERLPMPVRRLSARRCPLGPQPWVRTMLVLAQVSSMKTQSMVHE
jgi:hypothetical protein